MRDESRDVFHDRRRNKYVKSSTWQRRLRRQAYTHYRKIIQYGYMNGMLKNADIALEWKRLSRNG